MNSISMFFRPGAFLRFHKLGYFAMLGAFYLFMPSVFSAEEKPEVPTLPPPKFPMELRAPSKFQWKIEFRYDREKAKKETLTPEAKSEDKLDDPVEAPPPMLPKSIEVSKDGRIYREITTWQDGKKTEKWVLEGLQLREQPKTGRILDVDARSYSTDFSDYRRSDFEVAEWMGQDTFRGVKLLGSRPAYEFSVGADKRRLSPREIALGSMPDEVRGPDSQPVGPGSEYVAYLDAKSLMPIYIDDGEVVRIYSYGSLTETLVPPQKFMDRLNARKKMLQAKTRVPTPP